MKRKILIVDDSKDARKVLRSYVEDLNCLIDEADDGETAYNYCMTRTPDVIFLDWSMPNLSGIEFLRLYRDTLGQYKELPHVVYCTDTSACNDADEAIALGAKESIMMPAGKDSVRNVLFKVGGFVSQA